jgi:elongation factor 3
MPSVEAMDSAPAVSSKETAQSVKILEELIKALSISKTQDEANLM